MNLILPTISDFDKREVYFKNDNNWIPTDASSLPRAEREKLINWPGMQVVGVLAEELPPPILELIMDRYDEEEFLSATGLEEAVIGVEPNSMRLIYSIRKCKEVLRRDMDPEDVDEHFDFNILGAYMGEKSPIWCEDDF